MKKQLMIVGIIVILLTVGFSGCNEETKETSNPMIIHNFHVTPTLIEIGGTANITWDVTGATTVSINNNIGTVSLKGTIIIQPTQNTTYTLTATNVTDTVTATREIIINENGIISDEERLIGIWDVLLTWEGKNFSEQIWEFHSDYTFVITYIFHTEVRILGSGAWNITNNSLILTYTDELSQPQKTMDYVFSNNYNTVTVTDTDIIKAVYIFNRQF
ncbi:MAG: hypothetical protein MUO82_07425 [Candidatus Thermoplasmatota archaeon]|nr:hypothetical protein [Candidatus Thermoplasmatota archaeon]